MHPSLWLRATAVILISGGAFPLAAVSSPIPATIPEAYGKLPLRFEANAGQVDEAVRFLCRGQDYALFLTATEAVLRLGSPRQGSTVVRWQAVGGNAHPRLLAEEPLSAGSNYLLGNDPHRWRTGVPGYARVRYADLYPGVDLVYRGDQRRLEYDFVIAPRADPGRIRLAFRGADRITIGAQGELVLQTANGALVQPAPEVYQEAEGRRQRIEGHYLLLAAAEGKEVGFALGPYDRTLPLIIDPILAYSTLLGGSGGDFGKGIAVDSAGNAYVTGFTDSTPFPGVGSGSIQPAIAGGTDVFVTKINPAGTAIVYSTYLGGSGVEQGNGIAVDSAGNAYVTGLTEDSATLPGVNAGSLQPTSGGGDDIFVTKLNATGTAIVYSTFLGTSAHDEARAIAVDAAGSAYVTGLTNGITFPGVGAGSIQSVNLGGFDVFVTKINPAGTAIVYSTFLGGGMDDQGLGITVDGTGEVLLTGSTQSPTFTGVTVGSIQSAHGGGALDAFVTKINAAGTAIVYSTYLGRSGEDVGLGIAVDATGNAYVTGATSSTTFPGVGAGSLQPTYGGGLDDAFLMKIDPLGGLVYSTYLGGPGQDFGNGIAVDRQGNAYIIGLTHSVTFPGVDSGSIQPANGGASDAFVTKIDPAGTAIVYSTFFGGIGSETGNGIAVDRAGTAYITGFTNSFDVFVAKIETGLSFHTLTPCRLVDTRNPAGPLGGPALQPGAVRAFAVTGACGVPASARSLSVNVIVTQPAAGGDLRLLPGDQSTLPLVSTINYAAGQTRANNALLLLSLDGSGGLKVKTDSAGNVHFILDVNGYFE